MNITTDISRDQALCMLFYVEFTEENLTKYKKKLEDFGEIEICYNVDPKQPILVSKARILGDPFTYRKYIKPKAALKVVTENISCSNRPLNLCK
jgi:hypothetical protein